MFDKGKKNQINFLTFAAAMKKLALNIDNNFLPDNAPYLAVSTNFLHIQEITRGCN
jgi:hypothetical protein